MRMIAAVLTAAVLVSARAFAADAPTNAMSEDQKTLYALGLALGRNITVFQLSPGELKFVEKGLEDQTKGAKPKVDLKTYGPKIETLVKARQAKQAVAEKEKSKDFLEKAAAEKGAVKTETGLIYLSEKDGDGASPKAEDTVKASYKGTLIDGKVFDESKEPITFPLNHVIPCWSEGLQKMKTGGKAKLVCPSTIAYGDQGQGPIPGGATLIFEVELVGIEKPGAGK